MYTGNSLIPGFPLADHIDRALKSHIFSLTLIQIASCPQKIFKLNPIFVKAHSINAIFLALSVC